MAVWRTCASPGPGLPGSKSSKRRTSGPPCSWKRMALDMLRGSSVGSHRMGGLGYRRPVEWAGLRGLAEEPSYLGAPLPFLIISTLPGSLPLLPLFHIQMHPFLQCGVVGLARADPDDALDLGDEDFPVADLPRFGGLHNGFNDLVDQIAADRDLDAGLRHKVDHVLSAAI